MQILITLIAAAATMPQFLDPNDDPAEPMPYYLNSPVIISSLTGENAAAWSGSLNPYLTARNKRKTSLPDYKTDQKSTTLF